MMIKDINNWSVRDLNNRLINKHHTVYNFYCSNTYLCYAALTQSSHLYLNSNNTAIKPLLQL